MYYILLYIFVLWMLVCIIIYYYSCIYYLLYFIWLSSLKPLLSSSLSLLSQPSQILLICITILFLLSHCSSIFHFLYLFIALLVNEPNFSRSLSERKQLVHIIADKRQYFHNNIIQIVITLSLLVIGDTQKRIWKWHYPSRRSLGLGRRERREPIRIVVNLDAAFWLVIARVQLLLILRSRGVKWLEMRATHPW